MNELQLKNNGIEAANEIQTTVEQSGGSVAGAGQESAPAGARVTLRTLRAETEMQAISQALEQTGWNRKRAAQLLSISYRGLLYKIRQHNITKDQNTSGVPKRAKMADTLNWDSSSLAVAGSGAPSKD
ncbi:MAG: helix-turn-helix domain-containing protein [Candidatus Sulfotelmatobacter sp.]